MLEFVVLVMKIALVIEAIGLAIDITSTYLYKIDNITYKLYDDAKDIHFVAFLVFEIIMAAGVLYSMTLQ